MALTAKIQYNQSGSSTGSGQQPTELEFISWKGRPQQAKIVVDYTTRLGGSQLVISNIKKESPVTQSVAILASTNIDPMLAFQELEAKILVLRKNAGKRFKWIDERGNMIDRCYMVDFEYTIVAKDGPATAIAEINMSIMTDIDSNDNTLG